MATHRIKCFYVFIPHILIIWIKQCISQRHVCVQGEVSNPFVNLNGIYEFSYYNDALNGAVYYKPSIDKYIHLHPNGQNTWYIGSETTTTTSSAYAVPVPTTIGFLRDVEDTYKDWYVWDGSQFVAEPAMIATDCSPICMTGFEYNSFLNGLYEWTFFNPEQNSSVYYCSSCGAYLFGWYYPDSGWHNLRLGPAYTAADAWGSCYAGTDLGSDYHFSAALIDDCTGNWEEWHSDQWNSASAVISTRCDPTIAPTEVPTIAPTELPTMIPSELPTMTPTYTEHTTTALNTSLPTIALTDGSHGTQSISNNENNTKTYIILGCVVAAVIVIIFVIVISLVLYRKKKPKRKKGEKSVTPSVEIVPMTDEDEKSDTLGADTTADRGDSEGLLSGKEGETAYVMR